ncbi:MerR family transcriptional regulator [Sedimenticola sp.]
MDDVLTIGQLAQRTGIGVSAIRFYEQKGLIDGPPRNKSGYRLYPQKYVERVRFIKNCRDLGFPLRSVSELLKLCYPESVQIECAVVQERVQKQYEVVLKQFDELNRQREKLEKLLDACPQADGEDECGFLQIMLDETGNPCNG